MWPRRMVEEMGNVVFRCPLPPQCALTALSAAQVVASRSSRGDDGPPAELPAPSGVSSGESNGYTVAWCNR